MTVTISAPDGVPANAVLAGSVPASSNANPNAVNVSAVASKAPAGTSASTTLVVPSGAYKVRLPDVQFDGIRYVGRSSRPEVVVTAGANGSLDVTYQVDGGAQDLHVVSQGENALNFAWSGPAGTSYVLRRSAGASPPSRHTEGDGVPVHGTAATDTAVAPGVVYSYSLFTRRTGPWIGPLTLTTSIAPSTTTQATYVAPPSTLIATASDIVSTRAAGDDLEVTLRPGTRVPLLGAGVVLPITAELEGGFLGTVKALSGEGQVVLLTAAGLADAFDYYRLDVSDLGAGTSTAAAATPAAAAAAPTPTTASAAMAKQDKKPADPSQDLAHRAARTKVLDPVAGKMSALAAPAPAAATGPTSTCGKIIAPDIDFADFEPALTSVGHFSTVVKKFGPIPKSAEVDLGIAIKASGGVSAKVSGAFACTRDLRYMRTITAHPVPISALFEGTARVTFGGAASFSNVGVEATVGFNAKAALSATGGISVSVDRIQHADLLPMQLESGNAEVTAKVGGALTLGPGVGTVVGGKPQGAIAGVRGEANLVDATASFFPPVGQAACLELKAGASLDLLLTARAWLGRWSGSADYSLLKGSHDFPGSPWTYPSGCTTAPPSTPDGVIGPGVTKESDAVVGVPGQQGYSEGLIPGQKTWVLSTGLIEDAVGSPNDFASTDLQTAGDADLSTMSGYPTHDAASYQVTVVPTGSTLHVKYLFASEEYPEWVGSQFNDVMAVYVDGKNCAFVPGTATPVSINTVNGQSNSAYYVDNTAGAAGYNTSYDGLTLPLTCDVPVTPGKAVTIKIAVADGSDHAYDSAVALVEKGIWST